MLSEAPTTHGVKNTINIKHVESRDGGTYECRASNPYGVSTFNINLDIVGKLYYVCIFSSLSPVVLYLYIVKINDALLLLRM